MTWIDVHQPGPERTDLGAALARGTAGYPPEYGPAAKAERRLPAAVATDSIVLAHSLIPAALEHVFQGYRAMLDPALPLTRRQHEMIAVLVSATNRCFY